MALASGPRNPDLTPQLSNGFAAELIPGQGPCSGRVRVCVGGGPAFRGPLDSNVLSSGPAVA